MERGAFTSVTSSEFEWGYTIGTEEWNAEFVYLGQRCGKDVIWSGRIRGGGMGFEPTSSPNGKEPSHGGTTTPPHPLLRRGGGSNAPNALWALYIFHGCMHGPCGTQVTWCYSVKCGNASCPQTRLQHHAVPYAITRTTPASCPPCQARQTPHVTSPRHTSWLSTTDPQGRVSRSLCTPWHHGSLPISSQHVPPPATAAATSLLHCATSPCPTWFQETPHCRPTDLICIPAPMVNTPHPQHAAHPC